MNILRHFTLYFIFTVLCVSWVKSQDVPGYQGKKFSIFYRLAAKPAIFPDDRASYFSPNPSFLYYLRHKIELDYTIGWSASIGVKNDFSLLGSYIDSEHYAVRSHGPGVYIKLYPFFKKGALAPLGPYWQFEYSFLINEVIDRNIALPFPNPTKMGVITASKVGITLGHNILLKDLIFLSYGLSGGFVLGHPTSVLSSREISAINIKLRGANYFDVNAGFGFLIF